jgi:hypothetical protein
MSITCWVPKNINCKSTINTKCEDMLCAMFKSIEVIGVAGSNYIINTPNMDLNLKQLEDDTTASINKISESCPNCIIKDCTIVFCCISQSIGVIGAAGLNIITSDITKFMKLQDYTKFFIETMYSKVNCSNKNVNCTSVLCCISQSIGVIGSSGLFNISRQPTSYKNISIYTQLLIDNMYLKSNCSNKIVNCTDIQCCISTSIGVIGSAGSSAISKNSIEYDNIKEYTKLLIDNMYSKSNCSNKNVNCTDIQCCISQAIDVIDFSETIYSDNDAFDKIQDYTKYLKSEININCK